MDKNAKPGSRTHVEQHAPGMGHMLRNVILGGQDGVVNVLGLILGVATATNSSYFVILAGIAATFAECISMAAVAYTSTRAEIEHYESEVKRELWEMDNLPKVERQEIEDIYRKKGFSGILLQQVVDKVCSRRDVWLDTMMHEELGLENPARGMPAIWQAVIVGVSAMVGSFIPITPFFFLSVPHAMPVSLVASLVVLFAIGAYKSRMTSGRWLKGGLELMLIGGAAAFAGYLVGMFFQKFHP